ncbi:carbohydrate ABC transporter permease [Thermasporomyces composti]|jgi:ABC-type glycerol-3-phosphate transport system permease component|uniref:Carbohydrate ABC transporter membrane protein 2 (CUT1 family) n=1 Tax=Thermasporomyces composti TaxID=696763 RepID=A0A3D9V7Z5_THECX|nr:carbohydrate ABC transporter permease [Thermasporomyces composti]REF36270.1 carbohydrate ABC transporter membrane protein 2 (CUT1 family) [Thermasporomyces composti]
MSVRSESSPRSLSGARHRATRPATFASRSSGAERRRRRHRRTQLVIQLVLGLLVFVGLFPFLFMLITSFKTNQQYYESWWLPTLPLHVENYARAWNQIQPYFVTSITVAAISILGSLALCTIAAFVFARYAFVGRKVLFGLVAALLMVPGIASLIPMFVLMRDLGLLNTRIVLAIPHIVGGAVLGTLLLKTFVEQIPQELFDAARVDGAGGPRMFVSIMLPLSLPVVGTIALVTVIGVWNDFFWPLLTVTENHLRTVSAGLQFFQTQNATEYGPLFAGYAIASIPLLLLFVFLSKYFLAGLQGGLPGAGTR